MTRSVRLHPDAARELREAIRWYDGQSPRLGQLVLAELRRVLDRLRLFPEAYPQIKPGVRQAAIARLPYHVIYSLTGDSVVVLAMMHIRRDPRTIEDQLAERHRS